MALKRSCRTGPRDKQGGMCRGDKVRDRADWSKTGQRHGRMTGLQGDRIIKRRRQIWGKGRREQPVTQWAERDLGDYQIFNHLCLQNPEESLVYSQHYSEEQQIATEPFGKMGLMYPQC